MSLDLLTIEAAIDFCRQQLSIFRGKIKYYHFLSLAGALLLLPFTFFVVVVASFGVTRISISISIITKILFLFYLFIVHSSEQYFLLIILLLRSSDISCFLMIII
jgi:cobalamin biosynthesis protein CobD/CbiB